MGTVQSVRLALVHIHPDGRPLLYWTLISLGLFALALAVYWPALDSFFALDDFTWLRAAQNTDVPATVKRAFTFPTATPFQRPTPFWRP